MENNNLVKYENNQLQRAGNAIAITNKLLEKAEPQLIPYRKGDKWGFCTPDKKIVIDCDYDEVDRFSEDLARVEIKYNRMFINKKGEVEFTCPYGYPSSFSKGLASVERNYQYGYIDKNGNLVIPVIYDSKIWFSVEPYRVSLNGKSGVTI